MASTIRIYPTDNGTDRYAPNAYSAYVGQMIAVVPPGGGRVYGELITVDVAPDGATATLELDTGLARLRDDFDQIDTAQP